MIELTEERAVLERRRLLSEIKVHRLEARRAARALERLEALCRASGIRLIRESPGGQTHDRSRPQHR